MLGILISVIILMASLWGVARHDAGINFLHLLLLSLGITVVSLPTFPLGLFSIPVIIAVTAWGLVRYCHISLTQAGIVTAIYIASQTGLSLLFHI